MSSFEQLKAIRDQLQQQRIETENRIRQEALLTAQRLAQARLFHDAVKDVKPLANSGKATLSKPKPAAYPHQRERDEAQVLVDVFSDEFGIEQLLETDDQLSWRREGIGPQVLVKLRRGFWTIQDELDLHGARSQQARLQLAEFLREVYKKGLRCVRIVHGKGHGSKDKEPVLKVKVKQWLIQKQEVIAFVTARPAEGGSGALIVLLRSQ